MNPKPQTPNTKPSIKLQQTELKPSEGYDSDGTGLSFLKSNGDDGGDDDDARIKKMVRDVTPQFANSINSNYFDSVTKNMDGARFRTAWGGAGGGQEQGGGVPPPSKAESHNLDDNEPFEVGGAGWGDARRGNSVGRG